MDMSFALQFYALKHMMDHAGEYENGLVELPKRLDDLVAEKKLAALGVHIDRLTKEQQIYLYGE